MKTLRDVKIGETVQVVKLHGEGPVKRRIMDHGHHPGHPGVCPEGGPSGRPHGSHRPGL